MRAERVERNEERVESREERGKMTVPTERERGERRGESSGEEG